jgi:hypothetical protein
VKQLGASADRLAKGSGVLSLRLARDAVAWLKGGKGIGDFVIRLAFLALPCWIAWALVMAVKELMWVVALSWCITAWRAAAPAKPRTPPPPRPPAPTEPEEAGHEAHLSVGEGGVTARRVITWPDPERPNRTHVRVEQADTDTPQ